MNKFGGRPEGHITWWAGGREQKTVNKGDQGPARTVAPQGMEM